MKREIQFAMTKYRKRSYKLLTINCFNQLKITSKSAISPDENELNRHNLERVPTKIDIPNTQDPADRVAKCL